MASHAIGDGPHTGRALAHRVQDLDARVREFIRASRDDLIDVLRAEGSTEDQQRRAIGIQAEVRARLAPDHVTIGPLGQADDLGAQWHADACRPRQAGHDVLRDPGGEPGADAVGDARAAVGLMDDEGNAGATRGEIGRQRDVATEAHDDVGSFLAQDRLHSTDGS